MGSRSDLGVESTIGFGVRYKSMMLNRWSTISANHLKHRFSIAIEYFQFLWVVAGSLCEWFVCAVCENLAGFCVNARLLGLCVLYCGCFLNLGKIGGRDCPLTF